MHLVKLDFVRKKKWKKAIRQKSIVHYNAVLHSVISDILLFTVVRKGVYSHSEKPQVYISRVVHIWWLE